MPVPPNNPPEGVAALPTPRLGVDAPEPGLEAGFGANNDGWEPPEVDAPNKPDPPPPAVVLPKMEAPEVGGFDVADCAEPKTEVVLGVEEPNDGNAL